MKDGKDDALGRRPRGAAVIGARVGEVEVAELGRRVGQQVARVLLRTHKGNGCERGRVPGRYR